MFVKDVMSKNVVTIESDKTILEACKKYQEHGVGCLVVMKGLSIAGIITERDIIERVIIEQRNPKKTKVEDIMSKDIKTVHASAKVEQAAQMMKEYKIKKLPVILNNEIAGIITVTDLSNIMPNFSKNLLLENTPFKFVEP